MTVDESGRFTDSADMSAIEQLISVVQAYRAAAPELEVTTLSWRMFGDTKKLAAIIDGEADLHTRRHEKAMRWLSVNWPEAAAWPAGIDRPAQSEAAA
jgi:hypothetical protein